MATANNKGNNHKYNNTKDVRHSNHRCCAGAFGLGLRALGRLGTSAANQEGAGRAWEGRGTLGDCAPFTIAVLSVYQQQLSSTCLAARSSSVPCLRIFATLTPPCPAAPHPTPHPERRLLDAWVSEARRHGLRPHQFRTWIRRKTGPDLVVWRHRMDGTLGCATPCVFCQKELLRYDLRVHCSLTGEVWYSGRLDEQGAPVCKPTAGQLRLLFGQSPYPTREPKAPGTSSNNSSSGSGNTGGSGSSMAGQSERKKHRSKQQQLLERSGGSSSSKGSGGYDSSGGGSSSSGGSARGAGASVDRDREASSSSSARAGGARKRRGSQECGPSPAVPTCDTKEQLRGGSQPKSKRGI